MSTFDSPVCRCETRHVMVLTDQTQAQCARENGCLPRVNCPLRDCFTGEVWRKARPAAAPHAPRRAAA